MFAHVYMHFDVLCREIHLQGISAQVAGSILRSGSVLSL